MRRDAHLQARAANSRPLSPVDLLARTVESHPDRLAVAWAERLWTYRAFGSMVTRLAARLRREGVGPGDVVSVISLNRPEMLACHFAVPMIGAVLNTINTRLDPGTVAYILDHAESRLLLCDESCRSLAETSAAERGSTCLVFADGDGPSVLNVLDDDGSDPDIGLGDVADEFQPICLNYTSGTTGRPKGVVYHHRGAYLNALGNVVTLGLTPRSVYLWTLPMFHCNGWCHTWAVAAAGGLNVCIERADPALILPAIAGYGVTHLCCAPVVLYMLLNHPMRAAYVPATRVLVGTGGASPTSALIEQLEAIGFDLVHLYGLTESFGPTAFQALEEPTSRLPAAERAKVLSRQGLRHVTANTLRVVDPKTGRDVPADGATLGEIRLSGNTLMLGYYRDATATEEAFADGSFTTGDIAVRHADGAVEIRDRAKDVIISGGENVSSLEVEGVLHQHPAVLLAAVVASADEKWGEVPFAFVEIKEGHAVTEAELVAFCRSRLAGFKLPRRFVFGEIPKTATGKIQKFKLRDRTGAAEISDAVARP